MKDFVVKNMNKDIYNTSIYFYSNYPFFSELMLNTTFTKKEEVGTIGIQVTQAGLNMIYNPNFLQSLNLKQLYFIFIHELMHPLSNHCNRRGVRDPMLSNIVQDMIINTNIVNNFFDIELPILTLEQLKNLYKDHDLDEKFWKKNSKKEQFVFQVPKEYEDKRIFEKLYDWILDTIEKRKKDKQSNSKDKSNLSEETNNMLDSIENILNQEKNMKNQKYQSFDVHFKDEVDEETKRAIVDEIIDRARARGTITGNIEEMLSSLRPAKKNYLSSIKKNLSQLIGNKKKSTWQKPNRKDLPIKGYKKYKNKLNVISDDSGSMSGLHKKVYKFLYRNDIEYNLIHVDTEIKKIDKIKNKRELKKVKLVGFGGTELQPGIDYVKNNFSSFPTVILTDGFCDSLNFRGLKKPVLVLTTDDKINIIDKGGIRINQIVIDKEFLEEMN